MTDHPTARDWQNRAERAEAECKELREGLIAVSDWCGKRATALNEKCGRHVMAGHSTNLPWFRKFGGEHQAYMAVRSFIHGALKNAGGKKGKANGQ
jgi:hypothetical protein